MARGNRLGVALVASGLAAFACAARAQPPEAPGHTAAAAPATGAQSPTEDHVFALVQAGRCAQAKAAAEQADDANLADQIGLMCGAKSAGPTSSGGAGRKGGGRSGGSAAGQRGGH